MTTTTPTRSNGRTHAIFEDLTGLRAEGYVRDSTIDQKDGYGPDLQRGASNTFANAYGLILGGAWYTDFITGTSTLKRSGFQQALADAQLKLFDVLLVYHTSRFARNRADAIRYKQELRQMGITIVFVSQGFISGNDNDFLNEGINEVLDEQYSRNLSRFVSDGLRMKYEHGVANGKPPFGYRSEKLDNGKRERKVPDPLTMPVLIELLKGYSSGKHSLHSLATHMNSLGYSTRLAKPFTKAGMETILKNRFYEGKAVYHPGKPDEEVREGAHTVPDEVKELWGKCQEIRLSRSQSRNVLITRDHRYYPLSGPLVCHYCDLAYHGKASKRNNGDTALKMEHDLRRCETKPTIVATSGLHAQFAERVLPHIGLDDGWETAILRSMDTSKPVEDIDSIKRVQEALARLRKMYLWQDVSDEQYAHQKSELERELRVLQFTGVPVSLPKLGRAAKLLSDLPALWQHPGTTDKQRQEFSREVFEQIRMDGRDIVAIKPREKYVPLFAYIVQSQGVIGVCPTPVEQTTP
jgi:DNA invertase Pin-like site-specific DNA recombinase